ncbi:MAG: hypothetical protein Q8O41_09565 [Candidatus Methanoperedens sp.]|nr:hypothetical protein [Candidatus Methanoperedens sp.]
MDLDDCRRKGLIKKTRMDSELIMSLIEMSDIKENAVNTANVNEANISAYVSMAYDSLREVLEAVCIFGDTRFCPTSVLGSC